MHRQLHPLQGIAGQIPAYECAITAEGDSLVIWAKVGASCCSATSPRSPRCPSRTVWTGSAPRTTCEPLGDVERVWHQHARRLAGAALLEAADRTADAQARALLYALHRLFALRSIAPHTSDLLLTDRLRPEEAVALPDAADEIVGELVPAAFTLVAGFGIAEEVLNGHPIAARHTGDLPY
ncbi:acyl-CoA dehydrogenase [Streptomyces sp. NPDC004658]|uniref:acyl-CoA dehydrogenase n=1 Tax=Streptomyces sp. NPDC004658 TaxID=3154672 RepID=UPI0033A287A3